MKSFDLRGRVSAPSGHRDGPTSDTYPVCDWVSLQLGQKAGGDTDTNFLCVT